MDDFSAHSLDIVNVHDFFARLDRDIDDETRIKTVAYENTDDKLTVRVDLEYLEFQKWNRCSFYMNCHEVPFLRIAVAKSTGCSSFQLRTVAESLERQQAKRRPFGRVYTYRHRDALYYACQHSLAIHDEWLEPGISELTENLFFNTFAAMIADLHHAIAALAK